MEENNNQMNEIFDTNKGVAVNNKKKGNKLIVIICVSIMVIAIALGVYIILNKHKEEPPVKENLIYSEFDPLITKLDDDTYYIFGAKPDTTFEVTPKDNFTYQILDEKNNEVSTDKNNNVINPPKELYEKGKTYTIKIDNGEFTDTNLKNAKKVIFNIARPSSNTYTLKDETTDIKSDLSNYKPSDIFETIDYYGMEKINLSAFTTNEEVKNYLIAYITNHLLHTVYAKESIEIKEPTWDAKTNSLRFSIITEAKENTKLFDNNLLKNHQTKSELYVSVSANLYKDINYDNYEYALLFEYTFNDKVNLINTNTKITELNSNIMSSKKDYDATWLTKEYKDMTNDKVNIDKSLGTITINTEVPGLYVTFDLNYLMNADIKAITDNNMSGKITTTMGIKSNNTIYGNLTFKGQGSGSTTGDGNVSFGYNSKTSINYLNTKLEGNLTSLLDIESKSNIKEEDKKINYEVKSIINHNGTYTLESTINNEKNTKKIYDKKEELKKYEKQIEFTKPEEKKEENKDKYTAEEVRQKLNDAYNALGTEIQWSQGGGTFTVSFSYNKTIDTNNNKFTNTYTFDNSVSYTCNYDYLNKTMSCSNYDTALNYVKIACDNLHNEYLTYLETGECDNEDAMEWENLYPNIDSCYYEVMKQNEPTDYNEDFSKILTKAGLTESDLEFLK